MTSDDFYRLLPALPAFESAINVDDHADLPDDWWVVVADVVDSTRAIAAGDYKQVNTVGVACIAAVVNVDRTVAVPYLFGGDGAMLAVPGRLKKAAASALRGAQRLAAQSFGLDLRAGMVRTSALRSQGHWVRLAKVALSQQVSLPVFSGRGWEDAERQLKTGACEAFERIHASDEPAQADFSGFECRWQHVPSVRGHKLALIVAATSTDAVVNQATYRRVLAVLQERVGDTEQHHPLRVDQLNLTFRSGLLANESKVHTSGQGWLARWRYILRLYGLNLAGTWLFWRRAGDLADQWGRYRADLMRQTDYRKFDGALRTVLDVSVEEEVLLRDWLESERRAGNLVYGMHCSSEALITCLVEAYDGQHMHFVDGSDGGYALAARQLKAQFAARQPTA